MKAETLKQFLLKKYPTNEYFDCPIPKHHWEVIQEYAEHYARIQIEKDRERVKKNVRAKFIGHADIIEYCEVDLISINETPIALD